jgi:protein-histidine N-methyltransferase
MSAFTFSFGGDDIEEDALASVSPSPILPSHAAETGTLRPSHGAGVFPVSGQALLPAQTHILSTILHTLPERISYSTLRIELDDGEVFRIPRRELWDVRVQLMHEDEEVGLGDDDVKTGVYEGGFKSWESSVDLVRVLADRRGRGAGRIVEVSEICHVVGVHS